MIAKILYIVNVIEQFFVLNSWLGTNFNGYGFEVGKGIADMFNQRTENQCSPLCVNKLSPSF